MCEALGMVLIISMMIISMRMMMIVIMMIVMMMRMMDDSDCGAYRDDYKPMVSTFFLPSSASSTFT